MILAKKKISANPKSHPYFAYMHNILQNDFFLLKHFQNLCFYFDSI